MGERVNVVCVHQRPRSPLTNMLDLGVWMALQNVMEKLHFRKRKELDALASTTEDAWDELESIKLANVWNWWRMVLNLIIEDEGGNKMVKAKRGEALPRPTGGGQGYQGRDQGGGDGRKLDRCH